MKTPREMKFNELKSWLRERLQGRGAATVDLSVRRDEAPYERPVQLWKTGTDEFRNGFKRAVKDLIDEAGAEPWKAVHFHELGLLLEAADLWEAVGPLENIAHSMRLLEHEEGAQLRMLALRTLLALRWKGTLEFWDDQEKSVGRRWPAIIFEGLAQHDVATAFKRLPALVHTRDTMREILNLFPGLMRELRLPLSVLQAQGRQTVGHLPPEAAEAMRDWFRLRDCPLTGPVRADHGRLSIALNNFLGSDSEPRSYTAMLGGNRARGDLAPCEA